MDFGSALQHLKAGKLIARTPWLSRNVMLVFVPGLSFAAEKPPLAGLYPAGTTVNCAPYIAMSMGNGQLMNWQPSQGDILADDWVAVDNASTAPTTQPPAPKPAAKARKRNREPEPA